jgi:hypothetical protein
MAHFGGPFPFLDHQGIVKNTAVPALTHVCYADASGKGNEAAGTV